MEEWPEGGGEEKTKQKRKKVTVNHVLIRIDITRRRGLAGLEDSCACNERREKVRVEVRWR